MKKHFIFEAFLLLVLITVVVSGVIINKKYSNKITELELKKTSLDKEISSLKENISILKYNIAKLESKTNDQSFEDQVLNSLKFIPPQPGAEKKISECQKEVSDKYIKTRIEECEKLGYKQSEYDKLINQYPQDCILPNDLHKNLFLQEESEKDDCRNNYN